MQEHLDTLYRYGKECVHITELGVRSVVSTWALLAARPTTLVSVDIVECPVETAKLAAAQENIEFSFIIADSREISLDRTDLLFIDTHHTYDVLKVELDKHHEKVNKYIVLHDTTTFGEVGEDGHSRGLWYAVEEFLSNNSEWAVKERFTHCHGLTVLERIN